jgi:hypothetical protein
MEFSCKRAGDFLKLNGQPRQRLGRLHSDGRLDSTLTVGANAFIRSAALQSDGKIVAGGSFTVFGGTNRIAAGRVASESTLTSPMLVRLQFSSTGAFRFFYTNVDAIAFSVLATTNIATPEADWEILGSASHIGGGVYQFIDFNAPNHPRRFYKVRTP